MQPSSIARKVYLKQTTGRTVVVTTSYFFVIGKLPRVQRLTIQILWSYFCLFYAFIKFAFGRSQLQSWETHLIPMRLMQQSGSKILRWRRIPTAQIWRLISPTSHQAITKVRPSMTTLPQGNTSQAHHFLSNRIMSRIDPGIRNDKQKKWSIQRGGWMDLHSFTLRTLTINDW